LFFALADSGYAASSACTTASDELFEAATKRGVFPFCMWHTRRAEGRLSDEAGGGWGEAARAWHTGPGTAYTVRRLDGLRVRREQRLHHRLR
jgi:hypothetical protein